MILSVSRKTDIPAFYADWFFNRVQAGFCYTQNPMNTKQVRKVPIHPDLVDGIVFWTKNPKPMLTRIKNIKQFPFYFQYTLTAYEEDIETHLPHRRERIETFKTLSQLTNPDCLVWRYDPILLSEKYSLDYHIKHFEKLAQSLKGYSHRVIISFIDFYNKIGTNWAKLGIKNITIHDTEILADALSQIANSYGFSMESCSEERDFTVYNIAHGRCIDNQLLTKIKGTPLPFEKDPYQRKACGCMQSVDIGIYNSCSHGCLYCYASYSRESVIRNMKRHDKDYPLLLGKLTEDIKILDIKRKTQKHQPRKQKSLLDILR